MDEFSSCSLLQVLSRLRQSSLESVDSAAEFAEYDEYMHITREIESDLRILLRKINASNKKTMIILTGSAGDGKSHLISFLKNKDVENLLEGFQIINDATESNHPEKTAVETLAAKLEAFSDRNLENVQSDRLILAINLGMLNNFINSSYGDQYDKLRNYLKKIDVFTGSASNEYEENSYFHTISFSDYQVFSLKDGTYDDSYLLEVFSKITAATPKNQFFQAYTRCQNCPKNSKCPLMANFAFFSLKNVQNVIAFRIIQAVIEERIIVTMREIQNFIYEILVSPDFSMSTSGELNQSKEDTLKKYLHGSLPFLLYKGKSSSPLATSIRKNDPLSNRRQGQDEMLIELYSLNSLKKEAAQITEKTPFKLFSVVNEEYWQNLKGRIRSVFIDYMLLLKHSLCLEVPDDFAEYIKYLFYYYLGTSRPGSNKELAPLFRLTISVIQKWYGDFGEERMCLDLSLRKFWILEEIDLNLKQRLNPKKPKDQPIVHFQPSIELSQSGNDENRINLDYSLYTLLKAVEEGNNPTALERSTYIDFDRFIRKVLESGSLRKKVLIKAKDDEQNNKIHSFKYNGDYYAFT